MGLERIRSFSRKWAAWGLVLLALATLVNEIRVSRGVWETYRAAGSVDDVTRWQNRLAELAARIPPEVDRVGYISSDPEHIEFYLTQYVLIPRVLQRGVGPDWIIANYPGKAIQLVLQKQLDLEQYAVDNYGYGLYLIHKK